LKTWLFIFVSLQLAELQHEKEVLDIELSHERQENNKKESALQKLESENRVLSGEIETLNQNSVELDSKLRKQSEGMFPFSTLLSFRVFVLELLRLITLRY